MRVRWAMSVFERTRALLVCATLGGIGVFGRPVRAQSLDSTVVLINAAEASGDNARAAGLMVRMYKMSGFDPGALAAAAFAWARAGKADSAVSDFRRAIDEGFLDTAFIRRAREDTTLGPVRSSPGWLAVLTEAKRRLALLDQPVRRELLDLATRDQANRQNFGEIMTRFGRDSPQGDSAARALDVADAPILARLRQIIAKRGWPDRTLVGDDGAHAAWLILQHAPADVQRELLPRVRMAIEKGGGRLGDLALLEDRVLVESGKPQLYGSQMQYSPSGGPGTFKPIASPACVDERRSTMGLEPIQDYARRMGTTYTPPMEPCSTPRPPKPSLEWRLKSNDPAAMIWWWMSTRSVLLSAPCQRPNRNSASWASGSRSGGSGGRAGAWFSAGTAAAIVTSIS